MAVVKLKGADLSPHGFEGWNERTLRTLYQRGGFGEYNPVVKMNRKLWVDTEELSRWWEWYLKHSSDA